ncbi:hypothetical protein V6N12_061110 [Hibiscus sabdariffa]|uniref:Reverse transcriptase n=1 Tax=Hibiscus sabdariffa TaxID=183260 RepID=A0ABR2DW55_9ROSI
MKEVENLRRFLVGCCPLRVVDCYVLHESIRGEELLSLAGGEMVIMACNVRGLGNRETPRGDARKPSDARHFYDFDDSLGLLELPISGEIFTWSNHRSNEESVLEKLDRVMCSFEWSTLFPKAIGLLDVAMGSDHAPILILPQGIKKKYKKEFKFESKWLLEEECTSTVHKKLGTDLSTQEFTPIWK